MSPPIQYAVGDTVGMKVGSSVFFLAALACCEVEPIHDSVGEYVVGVYVVSCSVGAGVFDVYRLSLFFLCLLPPDVVSVVPDVVSIVPTFFFLVRISETDALTGFISAVEGSPFRLARNDAAFCRSDDEGGLVLRASTSAFTMRHDSSSDARCDVPVMLGNYFVMSWETTTSWYLQCDFQFVCLCLSIQSSIYFPFKGFIDTVAIQSGIKNCSCSQPKAVYHCNKLSLSTSYFNSCHINSQTLREVRRGKIALGR